MTDRWLPFSVRNGPPEETARYRVLRREISEQLEGRFYTWVRQTLGVLGRPVEAAGRINNILSRHAFSIDVSSAWVPTTSDYPDVIDAVLHLLSERLRDDLTQYTVKERIVDQIMAMRTMLAEARSLYDVDEIATGTWGLVLKVDATVHDQADHVLSIPGTAADYLRAAWRACYELHPDNEAAFDKAIEAIEAAARPVISPTNGKATLGTMIKDLSNKPSKWSTTLGTVEQLTQRLHALWSIQPRHGTPDPNEVREVTREEAVACVHEAVTLVHAFTTGLIRLDSA